MMRCPRTGTQLRFERAPVNSNPIQGPFNAPAPTSRGDFWVGIGAIVATILVITSEWLGWPMP